MFDEDEMKVEANRADLKNEEQPEGWCSAEFPSGCVLDSDMEDK